MGARPSALDEVAKAFADVRTRSWNASQLTIIDMLIDATCDELEQHLDRFDAGRFRTLAKYWRGRHR